MAAAGGGVALWPAAGCARRRRRRSAQSRVDPTSAARTASSREPTRRSPGSRGWGPGRHGWAPDCAGDRAQVLSDAAGGWGTLPGPAIEDRPGSALASACQLPRRCQSLTTRRRRIRRSPGRTRQQSTSHGAGSVLTATTPMGDHGRAADGQQSRCANTDLGSVATGVAVEPPPVSAAPLGTPDICMGLKAPHSAGSVASAGSARDRARWRRERRHRCRCCCSRRRARPGRRCPSAGWPPRSDPGRWSGCRCRNRSTGIR